MAWKKMDENREPENWYYVGTWPTRRSFQQFKMYWGLNDIDSGEMAWFYRGEVVEPHLKPQYWRELFEAPEREES